MNPGTKNKDEDAAREYEMLTFPRERPRDAFLNGVKYGRESERALSQILEEALEDAAKHSVEPFEGLKWRVYLHELVTEALAKYRGLNN